MLLRLKGELRQSLKGEGRGLEGVESAKEAGLEGCGLVLGEGPRGREGSVEQAGLILSIVVEML